MPQRYERVLTHHIHSRELHLTNNTSQINNQPDTDASPTTPSSPPPSFHSRANSPHRAPTESHTLLTEDDRTLAATFDSPSDDDSDDETSHQLDDRQRVMSGRPAPTSNTADTSSPTTDPSTGRPRTVERRVTPMPVFPSGAGRGPAPVHDGVFANLSAKPTGGSSDTDLDEKPPTYEQAAADATPPYWETTILTPSGAASDNDVFIDGLPVGTFFSFVWNAMISMSFQLVGFLLTYLLHTTHAAKNGSKAGLGITLIQYGFGMKRDFSAPDKGGDPANPQQPDPNQPVPGGDAFIPPPNDPNNVDFDPNSAIGGSAAFVADAAQGPGGVGSAVQGMKATDWFAYALMIVGWFILIRAISQYFKARRHEQLVLQSPSRGLAVPVVAEGEGETAA